MQLFLGLTAGGSMAEMGWIHFYADSRLLIKKKTKQNKWRSFEEGREERFRLYFGFVWPFLFPLSILGSQISLTDTQTEIGLFGAVQYPGPLLRA